MTPYELVKRDLLKIERSLEQARQRPNVPESELEHLEELCVLRRKIVEMLTGTTE